ncbi:hypothetical protein DPQ33_14325 [Oceanidesulfovibrio indonesiensis]|uniref:DUF1090 domain-containing protein n=1 Tax=Oceanidesulfovibrio indonesiensis TaxID=54767 RepID=A0A7M3MCW1_9BACT|nr:hypothetical protein [Oceanidesulfovibrio indonesiensis]TVM15877.1 hypothetical protein DPQ33_14325 [Oceanidesulfovibrio indonesiensis]
MRATIRNFRSALLNMLHVAGLCVILSVNAACPVMFDVAPKEQGLCRANPIKCTENDIAEVKNNIGVAERYVKRHEESVRVFGAPDCDDPWCEEQMLKHSKKVDEGREVLAQETKKLRELERKLADLQRGADGSNGGGGSSGGGSGH